MKTILLIDDDAVVRTLLAQYLKNSHWEVLEAEDGEGGLELAKKHQPAVVLCDLLLPRLNGFQVCAAISQDPVLRGTHVIAMSSKAYPKDRQSALEAGAEEFLLKPISPQALFQLLGRMVPETASENKEAVVAAKGQATWIKFWGVRGSIPAPGPSTAFYGGNTPCVEVRTGGKILILDSGTGIRRLGAALAEEFHGEPMELTILLTHTHWDHIQGFPFFAPIYNAKNKIRVLGFEGAREGLARVLSNQMASPHFPVGLKELPSSVSIEELKEMQFSIGPVKVRAAFANHPGVCVGIRIETPHGPMVYLPDHEPYLRQIQSGRKGSAGAGTQQFAKGEEKKMSDFVSQAEVLILDAQYDLEEYKTHRGWGHACVEDTVELAVRAKVRHLFLFHHDPDHDDAKITRMVERARQLAASQGSHVIIEAAREGERLEMKNEK